MDAVCFSALSNIECCKKVFSREQRVFTIKHYFLTKSWENVREWYKKQFPGANLPGNKAISCVICKFKNEYSAHSKQSILVT